ncbi:MAG: cation:proton antiporter subunit C [Bacillota bacterium]
MDWSALLRNYPYAVSLVLFGLGIHTVLARPNLLIKLIGLNIMQCGVFLFLVATGNLAGARPPIIDPAQPNGVYANPLPTALILTGIVVSVSVTAFALGLIVQVHRMYGTIDPTAIVAAYRQQKGAAE